MGLERWERAWSAHLCSIGTDAQINLIRARISSCHLRDADSRVGGRLSSLRELLEGRHFESACPPLHSVAVST